LHIPSLLNNNSHFIKEEDTHWFSSIKGNCYNLKQSTINQLERVRENQKIHSQRGLEQTLNPLLGNAIF